MTAKEERSAMSQMRFAVERSSRPENAWQAVDARSDECDESVEDSWTRQPAPEPKSGDGRSDDCD